MRRVAGVVCKALGLGACLAVAAWAVGCRAPASPASPASSAPSVAAVGSAAAAPAPSALTAGPGCTEAAAGFDSATRGFRAPESSFLAAMRERCLADAWPAAAIACFATMTEGELGMCAGELPMSSRDRMFAALGSGGHDGGSDATSSELSLAISVAKLESLRVGVAACDAFITAVRRALACAAMSVETRVALGAETADFWSLPSSGLPASAQQKMSEVCDRSRAVVEDQILAAGCMP
jgi:hypothetical protein